MNTTWSAAGGYREPAWRWQRAQSLQARPNQPALKEDDRWVARASQFLQKTAGNTNSTKSSTKFGTSIGQATALFQESPSQRRWELQARLLTDESMAVIADRMTLPLETVRAFEALFFDVRGYLQFSDWIACKVLRFAYSPNSRAEAIGYAWMSFAYYGGIAALDIVLAATDNRQLPDEIRLRLGPDVEFETTRLLLRAKLAVAAHLAHTPRQLADLAVIQERLQKMECTASSDDSQNADRLRVMSRLNRMIGGSSNSAPQTVAVKQTININEPVIDTTAE
jgi:hypothetical protein